MKARFVFMALLILLDITLVPWLTAFPMFVKSVGMAKAGGVWLQTMKDSPLHALGLLISDSKVRNLWLICQLLVGGGILWLLWPDDKRRKNFVRDGVGGPDAAGQGQFGTSRWQSPAETDATTTVWFTEELLNKGGIVLGMEIGRKDKEKVWLDTIDSHTLIIGTTRSGKSRTVILPTIWTLAEAGESMILTDPKGELYATTHKHLRKKGYKVTLIDFRKPGKGNRWNPMLPVIRAVEEGNIAEASEAAWDIASMFVKRPSSGDQVWADGAESTIAALILAVAMEADHKSFKHMTSVYQTLTELGETLKDEDGNDIVLLNEYFKTLARGSAARTAFGTARLAPERMRGSFFSSVAATLRLFADPSISYLTADQDHELTDVGKQKTAVFLVIPDEKKTRHVLAALYVDQTYQSLVSLADENNGRIPVRVNCLLDEFGNMPAIPDFATKITVSLGRGIRYHMVVQDFAQLDDKYGQANARTIRGNCHTWLYLLTTDFDTAKKISEQLGSYTIETEGHSSSSRSHDVSTSSSRSSSLTKRQLLTPDEILRWPVERALVIRARQFPARLNLPDISKWKANADLVPDYEKGTRTIDKVQVWIPFGRGDSLYEIAASQEESQQQVDESMKKKTIFDEGEDEDNEQEEDQEESSNDGGDDESDHDRG